MAIKARARRPLTAVIRMDPVIMILGQSAATAAVLGLEQACIDQDLPYARLRERMLADGQVLHHSGKIKPATG